MENHEYIIAWNLRNEFGIEIELNQLQISISKRAICPKNQLGL